MKIPSDTFYKESAIEQQHHALDFQEPTLEFQHGALLLGDFLLTLILSREQKGIRPYIQRRAFRRPWQG